MQVPGARRVLALVEIRERVEKLPQVPLETVSGCMEGWESSLLTCPRAWAESYSFREVGANYHSVSYFNFFQTPRSKMAPESRDPGAEPPPPQPSPRLFINLDLNCRDQFPPINSQSEHQTSQEENLWTQQSEVREKAKQNELQLRYIYEIASNYETLSAEEKDTLFKLLNANAESCKRTEHKLTFVDNKLR